MIRSLYDLRAPHRPDRVRHAHVRSQLAAPNTGCPREFTPRARTRLPYTPPLAPPNPNSGRAPALSHVPARARHWPSTSTASPPPYGLRAAVACHLVLALRNRSQRCPRSSQRCSGPITQLDAVQVSPNGSSITLRRRKSASPQIPGASTTSTIPCRTRWIGTGRRGCALTRAISGAGRTSRPTRETPVSGHTMQQNSLNAGSTRKPAACGRGCK